MLNLHSTLLKYKLTMFFVYSRANFHKAIWNYLIKTVQPGKAQVLSLS